MLQYVPASQKKLGHACRTERQDEHGYEWTPTLEPTPSKRQFLSPVPQNSVGGDAQTWLQTRQVYLLNFGEALRSSEQLSRGCSMLNFAE